MEKEKLEKILKELKEDKYQPFQARFFRELSTKTTAYEALEEINNYGFFDVKYEPRPNEDKDGYFSVSTWAVMDYLEKVTLSEKSDKKLIKEIIDKLIEKKSTLADIKNFYTATSILVILSELFNENFDFEDKYFTFIENCFSSNYRITGVFDGALTEKLLSKFLKANNSTCVEKLLQIILKPKYFDIQGLWRPAIDPMYLEFFIKENKGFELFKDEDVCIKTANVIEKIIKEMAEKRNTFSIYAISAIEENSRDFIQHYEVILIKILRNILERISNKEKIKEYIKAFLKEEKYSIFPRLGFYLINHFYGEEIKSLFWEIKNPLLMKSVKHEVYELLKAHFKSFTAEEIETFKSWVSDIDNVFEEDKKEENEKTIASMKREWLHDIKKENKDILNLDQELEKISDSYFPYPGYYYWIGGSTYTEERSSFQKLEDKLNSGNEEVVKHLDDLSENLILEEQNLEILVLRHPTEIIKDLNPFLDFIKLNKLNFLHYLTFGLFRLFEDNKNYSFYSCLDFFKEILENEKFWGNEDTSSRNNTINNIFNILKKIGKEDFRKEYAAKIYEIFDICYINIDKIKEKNRGVQADPLSHAINSTKGVFSEALIKYYFISEEKTFKDLFEKILKKPFPEFSAILGERLTFFPEQWTYENLDKIFNKDNLENWKASFYGFLFSCPHLHDKKFFNALYDNDQYKRAVEIDIPNEEFKRLFDYALIRQISASYFMFNISNAGELIKDILNNDDFYKIELIIDSIWQLRDFLKGDSPKKKIKEILSQIYERINEELSSNEDYQKIASGSLLLLFPFIENFDEDLFICFKAFSPYVKKGNLSRCLEYLVELSKKYPQYAGDLFYEFYLQTTDLKRYYSDKMKIIISNYFPYNKDNANKICNYFYSKGENFLQEIFLIHNKIES